jgi:hypothetical protein
MFWGRDIPQELCAEARLFDPRNLLSSRGYILKADGYMGHFKVFIHGDSFLEEVYRLTFLPEGRWIWTDKHGQGGGDMTDFYMEITGFGFRQAIFDILGIPPAPKAGAASMETVKLADAPQQGARSANASLLQVPFSSCLSVAPAQIRGLEPAVPADRSARPTLPVRAASKAVVAYLRGRKIPIAVTMAAIRQGFIFPLHDGVAFVGYDAARVPRWVVKRAIVSSIAPEFTKVDFRHSDKSFAPIFRGDNPESVWIVEGGVDALAVHALAKLDGRKTPSTIVSGGARSLSFLRPETMPPTVREVLAGARSIIVAREREKDAETQTATDAGHEKQAEFARRAAPHAEVSLWIPPDGQGKDIADVLVFRVMNGSQDSLSPLI